MQEANTHSDLYVPIQKIEDFITKIDDIKASGGKVKIQFELPNPLTNEERDYFNEVLSLAFAELIDCSPAPGK